MKTTSKWLEDKRSLVLRRPLALALKQLAANSKNKAGYKNADRLAIALQQVNYWVKHYEEFPEQAGTWARFKDGRWWVKNSYASWQKRNFDIWDVDTVKRLLVMLIDYEMLIVEREGAGRGIKTWYTVNYDRIDDLLDALNDDDSPDDDDAPTDPDDDADQDEDESPDSSGLTRDDDASPITSDDKQEWGHSAPINSSNRCILPPFSPHSAPNMRELKIIEITKVPNISCPPAPPDADQPDPGDPGQPDRLTDDPVNDQPNWQTEKNPKRRAMLAWLENVPETKRPKKIDFKKATAIAGEIISWGYSAEQIAEYTQAKYKESYWQRRFLGMPAVYDGIVAHFSDDVSPTGNRDQSNQHYDEDPEQEAAAFKRLRQKQEST